MRSHIEFYPDNWEWRDCRQLRKRPVEGVGTNDVDYAVRPKINSKPLFCPAYVSWSSMLKRCHNEELHQRFPTYVGTTCVKPWLVFSNFRRWYFQQRDLIVQYGYEGSLELDKDILTDSKTYGPSTCLLIPPTLNSLLLGNRSRRGDYPIGVSQHRGKFQAQVRVSGKKKSKQGFNTPEEAAAYRLKMKLDYVRTFPIPPWLDEAKVRPRLLQIVKDQK